MKRLILSLSLAATIFLTACHQQPPEVIKTVSYNAFTPAQTAMVKRIQASGAQVIKQGQRVMIVIPTDKYFVYQSTSLRHSRLASMHTIAHFLKSYANGNYRHASIRVYGFTDKVFAQKSRVALSKQYARVVAAFLWNAGIPQHRIIVRGLGAKRAIASYRTVSGSAYNRRVEILIRR